MQVTGSASSAQFAVFLDRDGTINVDVDYLSSPDELRFIPRSVEAIRSLNEAGIRVFVITNQSGIARGYLTETEMHAVHDAMNAQLKRQGAWIDGFFYCPHHPSAAVEQYKMKCSCRKPAPGMLIEAAARHTIDLASSFVIGDKAIDVQTGRAVGATCIQVATGYGTAEKDAGAQWRDHYTNDLYEAVLIVKSIIHQRGQPIT
ncbi:MAG TPA: D-glycero-beta-D-manno-heptose 1,7-bisphosphate 7-phosphatase [Bacteroidota bacterium]|nr:D-glycero-beta-D-manno-heptose 1,7-bisphosphate 7-phosphatase [Bacteroidota bacterium]